MKKILHGLPEKVIFCKRCVMSNQRPSTTPEHSKIDTKIKTAEFDNNGICHACLFSDYKKFKAEKCIVIKIIFEKNCKKKQKNNW